MVSYCKKIVYVLGEATVKVLHKNKIAHLLLLIIGGSGGSLIGRNWFGELGIRMTGVHRIIDVQEEFNDVFTDKLEKYKGPEITIQFKPNAKLKFLKS